MDNASEEGRGFRLRKKQTDPISCPVCGLTVRSTEIDQHFALEVDRLDKISVNKSRKSIGQHPKEIHSVPAASSSSATTSTITTSADSTWGTYQKIKNNRQTRLKIKSRKRKLEENTCPVCNKQTSEDISIHVEYCLRKNENNTDDNNYNTSDDESIDIEGESFEEYEWAGQTRVRASSLLQGGYSAAGIGSSINNHNEEDEDLNVDGDDTQVYGPSQYSERDIILPFEPNNTKESNSDYLRSLVIGATESNLNNHNNSVSTTNKEATGESSQQSVSMNEPLINTIVRDSIPNIPVEATQIPSRDQIIESLKAKIREYESCITSKCKCLICMDEFKVPVVSICCWHVHCEECWLRTLGARKLCPQCNMITSPSDLRRIYL